MDACSQDQSRGAKPRVLVVEDEMLIAFLMEDLLEELGCECVGPLATLSEALETARNDSFDTAILDLMLDRQVVYPVAEILAARGIPFAFATGMQRAGLAGGWTNRPCICKPYTLEDVRRLLESLLPSHG